MPNHETVLVLGASGQIGTDLVLRLRNELGASKVIATDIKDKAPDVFSEGPYLQLDVMDGAAVASIIEKHGVTQVYHLAALLSATAEKQPMFGWKLNMEGLFILLDIARDLGGLKIFWPSSIAVFGPTSPRQNCPQQTVIEPVTVYGISKFAGEFWCNYYNHRYGLDIRSIRYPGLISYKSAPGGGTTDYAVEIFHDALEEKKYESFLEEDTYLPMMYMPDAIRATMELMAAPAEQVKIRSSYNLGGISFTPAEIATEIAKHLPGFHIDYAPDFRQEIADSWPNSIDDSRAHDDWGFRCQYDLSSMTVDMLKHLKEARQLA